MPLINKPNSRLGFLTPGFFIVTISLVILVLPLYWIVAERNHRFFISQQKEQELTLPLDCSLSKATINDNPALHRTALTSFPRSGNTWIRLLVEKSTGYLTSSIYCDRVLRETFRAECNKNNTFLMKTHYPVNGIIRYPNHDAWKNYDQVIHVVRNPFDAILSYHSFHKTQNHSLKLDVSGRKAISDGKLLWYIKKYYAHYVYWRDTPLRRLLVRFEDLKTGNDEYVSNLLYGIDEFLLGETEGVSREMVDCAVKDSTSAYASKTQKEKLFYSLRELQPNAVKMIVDQLGQVICQMGYNLFLDNFLKNLDTAQLDLSEETKSHLQSLNCQSYDTTWYEIEN